MNFQEHRELIKKLKRQITEPPSLDILQLLLSELQYTMQDNPDLGADERKYVFSYSGFIKRWSLQRLQQTLDSQWDRLYWDTMLFEARNRVVDSYLIYLEKNRDPEDRFYEPRRKQFLKMGFTQALQDLIDDEIDILSISTVPGSGKTTLGEMFMSGFMGWFPDLCNLFSSHSGHVTRMVYQVVCNIIGIGLKPGQMPEYTWREIFPNVEVESNNANEQEINLGKFKPFKTLTCRALGASQTGVTRCEGILYCDDLCSGIEMALSKIRLDKLWTMYSTDLKTRKKKGKRGRTCKELHIATSTALPK